MKSWEQKVVCFIKKLEIGKTSLKYDLILRNFLGVILAEAAAAIVKRLTLEKGWTTKYDTPQHSS